MKAIGLSNSQEEGTLTIGLDLGDKYIHYCILDGSGIVAEEGRLKTSPQALAKQFESLKPSVFALEVGCHSRWATAVLQRCGHRVIVANAVKVRLIYKSDNKTDPVDARTLARLARLDPSLLAPIQHRGYQAQADLSVIRARDALLRARTSLVNCVRGLVKPTGIRLPACSTPQFPIQANNVVPLELRTAVAPLLQQIDSINETIWIYDKYIEHIALIRYPEVKRLTQIAGVGTITALTFVLTIDDPHRFSRSRDVGCYFGLRPRQQQSGERRPELGINKAGDGHVRRLLVTAAHYILGPFGPDTDLKRWGLALAGHGSKGRKKRAVAAVARKLAVLLHRLWISGDEYRPLREIVSEGRGQAA
jgi:transposase